MAIKNILLYLTQDPRNDARIEAAIALAKTHESHITALYVISPPEMPAYIMAYIPAEVLDKQAADAAAAAAEFEARFRDLCEREGLSHEWRQQEGNSRTVAGLHARYADIVVIGQTAPADERAEGTDGLADELVLSCGRPVLVIPYVGRYADFGHCVLVAWDGSREATRAVHDALPILEKANKVIVFAVNAASKHHIPGTDICAHLARHGIVAEAHHTVARDIGVGDALLAAVSDFGADVMVMGAYGHSRVRELALGGATRSILETMTVPVLLSH